MRPSNGVDQISYHHPSYYFWCWIGWCY